MSEWNFEGSMFKKFIGAGNIGMVFQGGMLLPMSYIGETTNKERLAAKQLVDLEE
jgi:hypothetical protein